MSWFCIFARRFNRAREVYCIFVINLCKSQNAGWLLYNSLHYNSWLISSLEPQLHSPSSQRLTSMQKRETSVPLRTTWLFIPRFQDIFLLVYIIHNNSILFLGGEVSLFDSIYKYIYIKRERFTYIDSYLLKLKSHWAYVWLVKISCFSSGGFRGEDFFSVGFFCSYHFDFWEIR